MAYEIILTPFSQEDTYQAYAWYEQQKIGLGDDFLNQLEIAYSKISLHPHNYSFIDDKKELRDFRVSRFPFLIVYRIIENQVYIIAVHHAKKHPSKKYR